MDLRFKKASMQLSDTTEIKKIKKDIARLETRLTELRFLKGETMTKVERILEGVVVSDKAEKTIVVSISTRSKLDIKENIKRSQKYLVMIQIILQKKG